VNDEWVANASPLILLGRIDGLTLIERLAANVAVPSAVVDEIRAGIGKDTTAVRALEWAELRHVQNVPVPPSVERWDLGTGESQVIAYALVGGRWAVLDDLAARRCAGAHGLSVIGTMGIVLRSKRQGLLPEAKPWIVRLRNAGMYIDDGTLNRALAIVGE
jgi:predicted nucleic acid-binding protein